jgi:TldD protein
MPSASSTAVIDLESLTALARGMIDRAQRAGAFLIWRAQERRLSRVVVKAGKVEDVATSSASGHGVHVVTESGHTALGSRDDFLEDPALALLDRTVAAAKSAARLGVSSAAFQGGAPLVARRIPEGLDAFDHVDLTAVAERLKTLERELVAEFPGVILTLSYMIDLDAWRVVRSDGADTLSAVPRCVVRLSASSGGDARHTVGASLAHPDPRLLDDPASVAKFLKRARTAAALATRLPGAPAHPAGSFPLVIDYALAKGLAHEAFGHASEADGFRSSVLAKDGRFRAGDTVGASHVSIVDEPVEGDYAWQPFSSSGTKRERATIVDHGRLTDALTDPWSVAASGVRLTGADRAESFRSAPLPRMSNIRVEVDDPVAASGAFEDYGPAEVRDLLAGAGVLARHPRVVYLSGYSGGQVNPPTGDFVFNCKAIYVLSDRGVSLHKPAIFSGSMFGALHAIREGFGPLVLDAIGTCGKWGQSVPSSGGSHYFLTLDPHDRVRLGGRS